MSDHVERACSDECPAPKTTSQTLVGFAVEEAERYVAALEAQRRQLEQIVVELGKANEWQAQQLRVMQRAENAEAKLDAWQSAFGISQLSDAVVELDKTRRDLAWEKQKVECLTERAEQAEAASEKTIEILAYVCDNFLVKGNEWKILNEELTRLKSLRGEAAKA